MTSIMGYVIKQVKMGTPAPQAMQNLGLRKPVAREPGIIKSSVPYKKNISYASQEFAPSDLLAGEMFNQTKQRGNLFGNF